MIESSYMDSDGFKLQFDINCSKSEQKFLIDQYPNVSNVIKKKIHCTTCKAQFETAQLSQNNIYTHPVLGVTQCSKCFAFYVRILKLSK